jgi:hypothetical protein
MAEQIEIPSSERLLEVARTRWQSIKINEPGLKLREKLGYAMAPLIASHRQALSDVNQTANLIEDAEKRALDSELELFNLRLKAVDVPQPEATEVLEGEVSSVGSEGQVFLNIDKVENLNLSITNIAGDTAEEPLLHDDGPRVNTLSDFELAEILYKRLGLNPSQGGMSMNGNRLQGVLNAFHYGPNREHYKN